MRVVTWEELGAKAPAIDFGAWMHHAGQERSLSGSLDFVLLDEKVAVETAHHVLILSPIGERSESSRGYCDLTVVVGGKIIADPVLVGRKVSLDILRIEGLEDEEPVETVASDGTVTFAWAPISRLYDIRKEVLLTVR